MSEDKDRQSEEYRRDLAGRPEGGGRGEEIKEERPYFGTDPFFQKAMDVFRTLADEKEKPEEKRKAKEKLPVIWETLMDRQLGKIEGLLDTHYLRLMSAYPYDSRFPGYWFDNMKEGLVTARDEEWGKTKEARLWLDELAVDTVWGDNMFKLLEGWGVVLPEFFDGKRMMFWVKKGPRSDPTSTMYRLVYKKDVPGMGLSEERKAAMSLPEGMKEGLRGKAVKYQIDNTYWRFAVAAVHQMEFDGNGNRVTFMKHYETGKEVLSSAEVEFIEEVFGVGKRDENGRLIRVDYEKGGVRKKVAESILNWYAMPSTDENKERYLAAMEALLTLGVKDKLKKPEHGIVDSSGRIGDVTKYNELINEVEKKVKERLANWFSMDRKLDERLAGVVAKAGVVMDWAHMTAGYFGWGWDYKKDNGRVVRERTAGATTVATDIITPYWWRDTEVVSNQRKGWTKGMLPPASPEYVKEVEEQAPGAVRRGKEVFEEMKRRDPVFAKAWDKLWQGSWDPKVKEALQNMVWFWQTSYKDEKTGRYIEIPIFFPPEVASLNFMNAISFHEDGLKIKTEKGQKKGGVSVFDELCSGADISELDWEKMRDQDLYRWMITIGQTVRFLTVMLDKQTQANRQQFEEFFENTSCVNEIEKRTALGVRQEKELQSILTLSLVPMLIVFRTADFRGIIGANSQREGKRTTWAIEVARWTTALSYLPGKSGDREVERNYGESMAKMAHFYATLIARLGKAAAKVEIKDVQTQYDKLEKEFDKLGAGIRKEDVTPS